MFDQLEAALRRALMPGAKGEPGLSHGLAALGVLQEFGHDLPEFLRIPHA